MKPDLQKLVRSPGPMKSERAVRPAIQIAVWAVGLVCVGLVAVHVGRQKTSQSAPDSQPAAARPIQTQRPAVAGSTAQHWSLSPANPAAGRPAPGGELAYAPKPAPAARQLIDGLVHLNLAGAALTGEQAVAWKENFQRLVQQGDAAIPAITEFLAQNADVAFGQEGSSMLGYASARAAMIDALMQIEQQGSSLAMVALDGVLHETANPQEIGQVAQFLEKAEPGLFQQDALAAARRTLAMAANGNFPDADASPLFQILQRYGGAGAAADLEGSANNWNHYAATALAQLPDQAGIPTLIRIARGQAGDNSSVRTAALEALAGMASQSSGARDTLLDLARQNGLPAFDWAALVPFLAGNQIVLQDSMFGNPVAGINPADLRATYLASSRQSFWTAPLGAMTAGQIAQQNAFLDQLLSATTDPAAIQAVQQAKTSLENRLTLLANSSAR